MEAWMGYLKRNRSIVVDIFQGQLRSTLTCSECSHQSMTFDPFMYLSLPFPTKKRGRGGPVRLEECIEEFSKEETLDGDECWRCPKCKDFRAATKRIELWKVPPVLVVHLKRFQTNEMGVPSSKINSEVIYPVDDGRGNDNGILDLTDFIPKEAQENQREAPEYKLYAVGNHMGGLYSGHYTAFVNNRVDNHWYHMNDENCSQIANEEAQTKNAYMLFFNKVQHEENAGSSEGSLRASDGDVKTIDIRRQSVSLPHLWPHVVQLDDIEGRPTLSRLVSDDAKWSEDTNSNGRAAAIEELGSDEERDSSLGVVNSGVHPPR
mmetsp:Transcript_7638/g.19600  ORF Transcript_7638/g.19600 Transcript_7638/m.19600 type:complete len:320 (+) Transcript_7638:949-1908(+)